MSYANRREMEGNRTVPIVIVALLHVVLGYALVSGLAYSVVKKAAEDLKTFDVEQEPPPPEEPPPPPKDTPLPPPPQVSAPPPMNRIQTPAPQIQTTTSIQPQPMTVRADPAPPAPPASAPPAPRVSQAARSNGSIKALFTDDDYPASALDRGVSGTAQARLVVGPTGRVTSCSITQSTGNSDLDRTVCRIIQSRARFSPAKDQNGQPISDTVTSPPIRFEIAAE